MRFFYLIVCISTIISMQSTITAFSFKKIYNYVLPTKLHQEVVYEEYNPKKITHFSLKNIQGNITITSDSKTDKIFLKATKKAPEPELLNQLTFTHTIKGQEFSINTAFNDINGFIDFEIIVPHSIALNVSTQEGTVTIKDPQAPTQANTQKGSITINNAKSSIHATTHIKGTIILNNCQGPITAQTNSGTIIINDAHSNVVAQTNNGSIQMFAREISSTSTIKLATVSGSILLHLPPDTNADLQAYTKQGTITSDHFITLKPQTTQLNRTAWKRLQKQVDGILGSGEAHITLSSVKSDIKLLEMKTT